MQQKFSLHPVLCFAFPVLLNVCVSVTRPHPQSNGHTDLLLLYESWREEENDGAETSRTQQNNEKIEAEGIL